MYYKFSFGTDTEAAKKALSTYIPKKAARNFYEQWDRKKMISQVNYKPEFIMKKINHNGDNFSQSTLKLLKVFKRDGLKCDCCGGNDIKFKLHKNSQKIQFKAYLRKMNRAGTYILVPMTLDHDVLDSLCGSNDVSNMHALCSTCNALRGNRWAEYKEFKDWYDSSENHHHNLPPVNYCYVNFKKNIDDSYIAKNLQDITCVPRQVKEVLTDNFSTGNIWLENAIGNGTMNFSDNTMNNLLNEMVQVYMRNHVGIKNARKPKYNFTKFPREVHIRYRESQIKMIEHVVKNEVVENSKFLQVCKNYVNSLFGG